MTSLYLYLKKTYWRPEDRWLCGGDGLGVMRYGYPGLPPTLTPGRKRDTITSVKSGQRTREKKNYVFIFSKTLLVNMVTFRIDIISNRRIVRLSVSIIKYTIGRCHVLKITLLVELWCVVVKDCNLTSKYFSHLEHECENWNWFALCFTHWP